MENKQTPKSKFLQHIARDSKPIKRRDIFEDYTRINSLDFPLPNTQTMLACEVWQRKDNEEEYLTKIIVGKGSIFFDTKVSLVVVEMLKELSDGLVPDNLRPGAENAD